MPIGLTNGVVMDVRYLETQLPAFANDADWQVWIGPDAPADAVQRLRKAGLLVQSVHSLGSRETELARQAPALALFLLLACAIIGSVVAVGGTAIAITASARRRSRETAALRVVGVPGRALYRGAVIEQVMLLGAAVTLGLPAGPSPPASHCRSSPSSPIPPQSSCITSSPRSR